jgi:hypothetical protein
MAGFHRVGAADLDALLALAREHQQSSSSSSSPSSSPCAAEAGFRRRLFGGAVDGVVPYDAFIEAIHSPQCPPALRALLDDIAKEVATVQAQ